MESISEEITALFPFEVLDAITHSVVTSFPYSWESSLAGAGKAVVYTLKDDGKVFGAFSIEPHPIKSTYVIRVGRGKYDMIDDAKLTSVSYALHNRLVAAMWERVYSYPDGEGQYTADGQGESSAASSSRDGLLLSDEDREKVRYLKVWLEGVETLQEEGTSALPIVQGAFTTVKAFKGDAAESISTPWTPSTQQLQTPDAYERERIAREARKYKVKRPTIELWEKLIDYGLGRMADEVVYERALMDERKFRRHKKKMRETGYWADKIRTDT
jgi:hypothetical protein